MKLWVDDERPAPEGYKWCHSVSRVIKEILLNEQEIKDWGDIEDIDPIELIDLEHDAGDYYIYGGDYIRILDWLEKTGRNYPIRIHSMNPVGVENMRRIIRKNGWKEVF